MQKSDNQQHKAGQRLKQIRTFLGLTQQYLADESGISRTAINNIEASGKSINSELMSYLHNHHNISYTYMIDGVGEMVLENLTKSPVYGQKKGHKNTLITEPLIEPLIEPLTQKKGAKKPDYLERIAKQPKKRLPDSYVLYDEPYLIQKSKPAYRESHSNQLPIKLKQEGIPVYDLKAFASLVRTIPDEKAIPKAFIYVPHLTDCNFAIDVQGDSMQPRYPSGSMLFCKELTDIQLIRYGHPYLFVTEEYRTLKYAQPSSRQGYIRLQPGNEYHPSNELPISKLQHIYTVRACLIFEDS